MVTCTRITSVEQIRRIQDYIVLDVKATGRDPKVDQILEIGMARVSGGRLVNTAGTYINPEMPIPLRATRITGIRDQDVADAFTYEKIAPSIANLLLGTVVVAHDADTDMWFIKALLEQNGYSGEIPYIDTKRFARFLLPELEDHRLATLVQHFDLETGEEQRAVDNAVTCFQVLQALRELPDPEDLPSPEEASEAAVIRRSAAARPGSGRSAARKPDKGAALPSVPILETLENLLEGDVLWYVLAGISAVLALVFIPSIASILFLLAAIVFFPLPLFRDWMDKIKLNGWKLLALGLALAVAGLLLMPAHAGGSGSRPKTQTTDVADAESTPSPFLISADKLGEYGTEVVLNEGTRDEVKYIAFHVPVGAYRVTNKSSDTAQIAIYDDGYETDADGLQQPKLAEDSTASFILANTSKDFTVKEGQYVRLSEGSRNMLFEYQGETFQNVVGTDKPVTFEGEEVVLAYVNGSDVRFRSTPSLSGFVLGNLEKGTEVQVTGVTGEWTAGIIDNQAGYIFSKYLSVTPPA